jgi:hypothetical protein
MEAVRAKKRSQGEAEARPSRIDKDRDGGDNGGETSGFKCLRQKPEISFATY